MADLPRWDPALVHPPLPRTCDACLTRVSDGRCRCLGLPQLRPPPMVYVSNWASTRTPGFTGPARRRVAIVEPRSKHTRGVGTVETLMPSFDLDEDMRLEPGEWTSHNARYAEELWGNSHEGATLRPGRLLFRLGPRPPLIEDDERPFVAVRSGDSLLCSCGRTRAAQGECHRVLVASALLAHGWRVVLDGVTLDPQNSDASTVDLGDVAAPVGRQ